MAVKAPVCYLAQTWQQIPTNPDNAHPPSGREKPWNSRCSGNSPPARHFMGQVPLQSSTCPPNTDGGTRPIVHLGSCRTPPPAAFSHEKGLARTLFRPASPRYLLRLPYSNLSASTGFICAARVAGTVPKTMPTPVADPSAMITERGEMGMV